MTNQQIQLLNQALDQALDTYSKLSAISEGLDWRTLARFNVHKAQVHIDRALRHMRIAANKLNIHYAKAPLMPGNTQTGGVL